METVREMLRRELGRSLHALPELDRLRAAWRVACGRRMAGRGEVTALLDGVVQVEAEDAVWLGEMLAMRGTLERELGRIANVKLNGIHFYLKGSAGSERR